MKHLFHHLPKLAAIAAIALSASSCNRAEYAMLPKTSPYHATYHGTAKPAPAPVAQQEEIATAEVITAPVEEKNIVAETPAAVPAVTPAATPAAKSAAVASAKATKPAATSAAPRKLNLVERAAFSKVTKKLDKLASKAQLKQRYETAETSKIGGYLRTGIILILVGLLISLLSGISGIFGLIGGIISIIGLIFIILWLLDEV
ncbi:hypothetical protein [Hymenobacter sediminicola]|uniref:Uncharacterized protein n=1 Tax=Hymenobacter sediminicola TaxID=2761579 RepID=A0A7G7WA61_9BACT|nr:hypothetical protein [Hymenobacter sediminicola]QNH63254.1 hypothetical protein H4317_05460 [Hymenobacter sediminicola]